MDPHLALYLREIIKTRQLNDDWAIVFPKIVARIDWYSTGASIVKPDPTLVAQIHQKRDKITRKLTKAFSDVPPFTLVRFAELLEDPAAQGYPLSSTHHILKYFNALCRLVCVSSTINEFAPATFLVQQLKPQPDPNAAKQEIDSDSEMISTLPANLHVVMVKIPWLKKPASPSDIDEDLSKDKPLKEEVEVDSPEVQDESEESPPAKYAQSSPKVTTSSLRSTRSPVRRRRTEADEEVTKRPRTNTIDDDKMDISHTSLDDGDSMDISTENILEESDRSEVCTPG